MKTIKLMFETSSSNEDYNADFDYAIVKIDVEKYQLIAYRLEVLRGLKERDDELYKLCAWDYRPQWISRTALEEFIGDDNAWELEDKMTDGRILLPEGFEFPEEKALNVEIPTLVVAAYGTIDAVYWTGMPKHSDILIETRQIELKDLKELMR